MKLCLFPSVPMCATSVRYQRGIRHAIHWYAKANGKYTNDYDPNKESSYLMYWDVNNLYELEMS